MTDYEYPFLVSGFSIIWRRKVGMAQRSQVFKRLLNGDGLARLLNALDVTSRVKLHQTVQVVARPSKTGMMIDTWMIKSW